MAITKIHPIKYDLNGAINYITNPKKTLNKSLVSTYACDKETAFEDFLSVLENPRSTAKTVKARHLIQSFKPGEIDVETAHEIGYELAEKHFKGYQFIIATHVDKEHIHNHILINNVSFLNYKSYNSNKKSYQKIKQLSDQLCKENGLSIIEEIDRKKQIIDPDATQSSFRKVYRLQVKRDIDLAIQASINFEDFLDKMRLKKYEIKEGKYIAFRNTINGQKRFIRTRSLGSNYSDSRIKQRINNEFRSFEKRCIDSPTSEWVSNIIDTAHDKKFTTEAGLRYWAVRQNNQTIVQTISEMNSLGIDSLLQLNNYLKQIDNEYKVNTEVIEKYSQQIDDQNQLLNDLVDYKQLKNRYSRYSYINELDMNDLLKKNKLEDKIEALEEKFKSFNYDLSIDNFDVISFKISDEITWLNQSIDNRLEEQKEMKIFTGKLKRLANNYNIFLGKEVLYPEIEKNRKEKSIKDVKDIDRRRI